MNLPEHVTINEVGLRDGLQLENKLLTVSEKKLLLERLEEAHVQSIEFGSFVHPKAVPQMANTKELFLAFEPKRYMNLSALIPNLKGAMIASDLGVKEVNYVFSASNTHNQQNVKKSTKESLEEFHAIKQFCDHAKIKMAVTLATSFGCPFEGEISESKIQKITDELVRENVYILTFADTTGMANPKQVYSLSSSMKDRHPDQEFGLHFHNTRGMGLANILAGLEAGIQRYDTALGGIGGCPFAPGATGNVSTEDVVHMLEELGVSTHIDLDLLVNTSKLLEKMLGHSLPSQVLKAGKSSRRYPIPNHSV